MVPQCFELALTAGKEPIHFNRGWRKGKEEGRVKGKEGRATESRRKLETVHKLGLVLLVLL